ncbi:MAG TPA: DUF1572 family protein [Pirellulales bacterium]|jgi:uncharacterized damage-inducible protein DinB|nr:DUF1572 family protein [Pirellulales bacterium]
MPIEAQAAGGSSESSIGEAFLAESRQTLAGSLKKIVNCFAQLDDSDLWWRQHESHNSIQNVVLHLCGNVRQWIVHGVGGEPDVRHRPSEFADRQPLAKVDLLARLQETLAQADRALASFPAERLLESRRIQGFETKVLAAIFETVSHFVGHTHQIVYITRLRLGDAYRFQWTPADAEQGA